MTIKNGDLPAAPSNIDAQTFGDIYGSDYQSLAKCRIGMTKREEMAKDFLAAILASGTTRFTHKDCINLAIKSADDLLDALERTK